MCFDLVETQDNLNMKPLIMHNTDNLPFGVGSFLAIIYNFYNFLNAIPLLNKLIETSVIAIVGVIVSGLATYLCRKYFPKYFKK